MSPQIPTLRWGIISTGRIASMFVQDISLERVDARARHIITAIGSSSPKKGQDFAAKHFPGDTTPAVYGTYQPVYTDPNVDIIYIGTPNSFHKQNCLDAIAAGKHVLCEKPFALNAKEARDVFDAAEKKGVFIMEAMWMRFSPLVRTLCNILHEEKAIGQIHRVFCDFALHLELETLAPDSRLNNPALGGGSLLEIGIYSLTWGLLAHDSSIGDKAQKPSVVAAQSIARGVDVSSSIILTYPAGGQAILTSSALVKSPAVFCRIEGSDGFITIQGLGASLPDSFTVSSSKPSYTGLTKYNLDRQGWGFYWEADAVALDIAADKTENEIIPWAETVRCLEILDEVRRQGGARFPQD